MQPEEALEIGEDLEEIEQLRDIEEIDHQPEVLDLREKGYSNYPTPPATEDSTYFLENSEIAIPVKNIAASQQRLQNQEELEDKSLIDELEPARLQKLQTQEELEDENLIDELEPAFLQELKKQKNERFYDFNQHRIPQVWQTSFETARFFKNDQPIPPRNYRELKGHKFEKQFRESMEQQIHEHRNLFNSWNVVNYSESKEHKVLGCHWVFTYKPNKHGQIMSYKARLVVRGDQQPECDMPTRATTLALASLRVILAIIAKFDLETYQLDAVNAFVHADIDEIVYMRLPPRYTEPGKVLRLNKALYGLCCSPLLWQQKITSALSELGFKELPQEPCIMIKNGIICFYFVDDIVFAFRQKDRIEVQEIIRNLKKPFTIKEIGDLKWFLGMHIIRDRQKKTLWLSQLSYIEKVKSQFISEEPTRLPDTPIQEEEFLPSDQEATEKDRTVYQQKIGSVLFAAIASRPDIAFAIARLSRFNQNPGQKHQDAINRLILYIYKSRYFCIKYGHKSGAVSFICASDASFADNTIDRKSSQGYAMKLFGGFIAWRANKQDTVTTSSTEAELLALSQTAKEAIYMSRLLIALRLEIEEPLTIECDNRQTIRLLVQQAAKLQTKHRHVDIHSHWLRQEVQRGAIYIKWQETKQMIADSLTRALGKQPFNHFIDLIGIENLYDRLEAIRKEDELSSEKLNISTIAFLAYDET